MAISAAASRPAVALSQTLSAAFTRSAIFLVVTINPGDENRAPVLSLCADLPGLLRAVGFRALEGALSCIMGFGSDAWDRLFGYIADHIDHAVKIAGINHVGIGSDFDGIAATANALEDVSKMLALVAVLMRRGYSESALKKILGGNFLHVVHEIVDQ